MNDIEYVSYLERKVTAAIKDVQDAVKKAYPIGGLVEVQLGKSLVVGEVERYGSEYEPGYIYVRNHRTKALRQVNVTYHKPTLVFKP